MMTESERARIEQAEMKDKNIFFGSEWNEEKKRKIQKERKTYMTEQDAGIRSRNDSIILLCLYRL